MKTVTKQELASEILPASRVSSNGSSTPGSLANASVEEQATWASQILDSAFGAILEHLKEGHRVELDDFLSLSVTRPRNAELREDEYERYLAYAPVSGQLKAVPIGNFARTLHLGQVATLYFLTSEPDEFADILNRHFKKGGWNVVVESDPGRVLARVDREVPYAVLIESCVAGWQDLVRGLKCSAETNGVPILVIDSSRTGNPSDGGFTMKHDETIQEPFDVLELIETMEDRLSTRVATIEEEMLTLSMTMQGDPSHRRQACSLVTETLTRAQIAPEFARASAMALNEILTNAVVHGHGEDLSKTVTVRVMLDRKRLLITVRDEGEGFDHTAMLAEARKHKNDPACQTGLSRVMRTVERVEYNRKGNQVILTKMRK